MQPRRLWRVLPAVLLLFAGDR